MVNVRELLVPIGVRRKGKPLNFKGVTAHNADNPSKGANADANARYQASTPDYKTAKGGTASWQYTVDEKEIVRSIPENEVAYHCGNNEGNNTTIGVEICDNADGDLLAATNNAAELTADILRRHGHTKAVWGENLFQHHDWANKDCPSKIRAGQPYGWDTFVAKVNEFMGAGQPQPTPTPEATIPDTMVYYRKKATQRVYFRSEPRQGDNIIRTLDVGTRMRYKGDSENGYIRVRIDGQDGYVYSDYTAPDYIENKDNVVTMWEEKLRDKGYYSGKIDGTAGPEVAKAIAALQRDKGLTVDYIGGPNTRKELFA